MLELLLVLSLLGNGYLLKEQGEIEQSSEQLQQVVVEQDKLIGEYYHEVGALKGKLNEAERERNAIFTESEERAKELEELRNSDSDVDVYLSEAIPDSVVEHLQSYRED